MLGLSGRAWLWIALAAIAFVGLLQLGERQHLPALLPQALQEEPDLYFQDARIAQFDAHGDLAFVLEAAEVHVFEARDLAILQTPRLMLYRGEDAPWHLTAGEGRLMLVPAATDSAEPADEELVTLHDAVELFQTQADGGLLRLRTEQLQIYPRRRYVTTNEAVMIESSAGVTQAVGMRAQLIEGRFELGNTDPHTQPTRVHTIVAPHQFQYRP